MSIPDFQERAKILAKPGDEILLGLNLNSITVLVAASKDAVEAGKLVDAAKKFAIHGKSDKWMLEVLRDLDAKAKEPSLDATKILEGLSADKAELLHSAVGISGEASEILEQVSNHIFSGEDLDVENILEELGDLKFFIALMQNVLGLSDEQINLYNHKKLEARYPSGTYSDAQAQARADKQ